MFKRKDVIFILLLTFITTVAWIASNIYHIIVTSTINEELQTQITQIDPNFDTETIELLKGRERIEPLYQFRDTNAGDTATATAEVLPTDIPIEVSPTEEVYEEIIVAEP
jgi:hypothetical protein